MCRGFRNTKYKNGYNMYIYNMNICHEWGSNPRPPTQFLWTMIDRAIVVDNTPTYRQKFWPKYDGELYENLVMIVT